MSWYKIEKHIKVGSVTHKLKAIEEEHDKQLRADAKEELFNRISEILSVEMADCKTCPIGCEVNTYGGCQEEIKKYLLEQMK